MAIDGENIGQSALNRPTAQHPHHHQSLLFLVLQFGIDLILDPIVCFEPQVLGG